ncbi:hypothetical protein TNCV_4229531 [Trichonephila clavipes]|nr:hypothetical protein TNCV_4229531 [Trichonephila clavipes]
MDAQHYPAAVGDTVPSSNALAIPYVEYPLQAILHRRVFEDMLRCRPWKTNLSPNGSGKDDDMRSKNFVINIVGPSKSHSQPYAGRVHLPDHDAHPHHDNQLFGIVTFHE